LTNSRPNSTGEPKGAFIGGGGSDGSKNTVSADHATIGGGIGNEASDVEATVGGGDGNSATGSRTTVSGGQNNEATKGNATVVGGVNNVASGGGAVAGGESNSAERNYATVFGRDNEATGLSATIAGGGYFEDGDGNSADGDFSVIGGGTANATIGAHSTVSGGEANEANAEDATVGGGTGNTAASNGATVGGGGGNTANGSYAVVAGGSSNSAVGQGATVGGGISNDLDGLYATLGGGFNNALSGAASSTIGGGQDHNISADAATIGGGENNTIQDDSNDDNNGPPDYATIPGGLDNTVHGQYAFAAGRNATADLDGSFVWGDHTSDGIESFFQSQARFQGNVRGSSFTTESAVEHVTDDSDSGGRFGNRGNWRTFYNPDTDEFKVQRLEYEDLLPVWSDKLWIDENGNLTVDGDVNGDQKNFVESVDTEDGEREVVYTSTEAGTPRTEASGVARLEDGRAEIGLPEHFSWVTSDQEPLLVQTTPYGGTAGLKVVERSTKRIVVEDLDGEGDYEFAYTVKGTRRGKEDKQVVREPRADRAARGGSETPADD